MAEKRNLRAKALRLQLQAGKARLHAEQVPMRQEKTHAVQLYKNGLRGDGSKVSVPLHLIKIRRVKRIG